MARKLAYDQINKRTFMRENVQSYALTGTRVCAACKKPHKILFHYWYEKDIGGDDKPDKFALPFCCIKHYRDYYGNQ
jgi:hypothetical protein